MFEPGGTRGGAGEAPLVGVLLVGGESRRFGRPKQLAHSQGVSFAEHVATALAAVAAEVVVAGAGELPAALAELARVEDAPGSRGPLAGVLGALAARPGAAVLVAACDQPLLRTSALEWLLAQRRPDAVAVVARREAGGIEPLPGIYEARSRALLEELATTGGSLQPLAARPDVVVARLPDALRAAWTSVDSPAELERLDLLERSGPGR